MGNTIISEAFDQLHKIHKGAKLVESCGKKEKECSGKKCSKEDKKDEKKLKENLDNATWKYQDLIADLADRVDGEDDDAIWEAMDEGLIYDEDQWTAIQEFFSPSDIFQKCPEISDAVWEALFMDISEELAKRKGTNESLNEKTEISAEDKADSEVIRDVYNRLQKRNNAKITDKQQAVLDKYGISKQTKYGDWYLNNKDTSSLVDKRGTDIGKGVSKTEYSPNYHSSHQVIGDKVNLADKARKANGPRGERRRELEVPYADEKNPAAKSRYANNYTGYTPGYDAEQKHGETAWTDSYDNSVHRQTKKHTELTKERQRQATNMYRPYRNMKVALADRKKHQTTLDNVDRDYANDVAYAKQSFDIRMKDAEERRRENRKEGEEGVKDANARINKLLKRGE